MRVKKLIYDAEYLEEFKKFKQDLVRDQEACIKFLIKAGVYNKNGKLKKRYR